MSIKMRTKLSDGVITLKALIKHPMETGTRKDKKTGNLIPANHITDLTIMNNDTVISRGEMSTAVSKNPFIGLKLKGEKGDVITLSYEDNMGKKESAKTTVK